MRLGVILFVLLLLAVTAGLFGIRQWNEARLEKVIQEMDAKEAARSSQNRFAPKGSGFSVMAKSKPFETNQILQSKLGDISLHQCIWPVRSREGEPQTYVAQWLEFPPGADLSDLEVLYDRAARDAEAKQGRIIKQRKINSDNLSGHEMEILVGGTNLVLTRTFIHKRRQFQVTVIRPNQSDLGWSIKFLDSFRLEAEAASN